MSVLGDVIDRLVVVCRQAVTVPVYDGPKPESVNHGRFVTIATNAEGDDGAIAELTPSTMGAGDWRDELGEVECAAWAWSGGDNVSELRSQALADAETCLSAIWADRSLGGLLNLPGATTSAMRYEARQASTGSIVRITFTVAYQALITT